MPKVYLSPPYHKWNPCAIEGCDETTHNNMYLDELEVYLKASGIEYKRGAKRTPKSDEDGTEMMIKAVAESNLFAPDIHYVSHTNAANTTARGYRPIIYPGYIKADELAEIMIKYRKEIYDMPVTLNKRTNLYELYATNAIAYYEEHAFHDNVEDAKWFHDNMRLIAKQTCKAFCEYFNIPFVDPYEQEVSKLYRVRKSYEDKESQMGAFTILQNAISLAQKTGLNVYDMEGNLVWQYDEPVAEMPEQQPEEQPEKTESDENVAKKIKNALEFILNLLKTK